MYSSQKVEKSLVLRGHKTKRQADYGCERSALLAACTTTLSLEKRPKGLQKDFVDDSPFTLSTVDALAWLTGAFASGRQLALKKQREHLRLTLVE